MMFGDMVVIPFTVGDPERREALHALNREIQDVVIETIDLRYRKINLSGALRFWGGCLEKDTLSPQDRKRLSRCILQGWVTLGKLVTSQTELEKQEADLKRERREIILRQRPPTLPFSC
jgi:hypothetical protein